MFKRAYCIVLTYGCGLSSYEATNDAAKKISDKLASISEVDDYSLNSTINIFCLFNVCRAMMAGNSQSNVY